MGGGKNEESNCGNFLDHKKFSDIRTRTQNTYQRQKKFDTWKKVIMEIFFNTTNYLIYAHAHKTHTSAKKIDTWEKVFMCNVSHAHKIIISHKTPTSALAVEKVLAVASD